MSSILISGFDETAEFFGEILMDEYVIAGIQPQGKLKGSYISPFESHHQDIANTFYMLHKAVELLKNTYYQSPHWDHEPSSLEKAKEREYFETCEDSAKEVERLAGEIYLSLTGKRAQPIQTEEYVDCKSLFFNLW